VASHVEDLTTVNVSDEGTVDWFYIGTQPAGFNPRAQPALGATHTKIDGPYWLADTFDWIWAGASATNLSQASARVIQTNMDESSARGAAINSQQGIGFFNPTGGTGELGWGCRIRVPASATPRTLNAYLVNYACDVTMTATLTDGTTDTTTFTGAVSAGAGQIFSVVFSGDPSLYLVVTYTVTGQYNADMSFKVQAFTLFE